MGLNHRNVTVEYALLGGASCITGTRRATDAVYLQFMRGESISDLCDEGLYTVEQIEDAIRYEMKRRRGRQSE